MVKENSLQKKRMHSNQFPPELQPVIDELDAFAFGGPVCAEAREFSSASGLGQNDGYQDLKDAWRGVLMALDLSELSTWSFRDSDRIDYKDCEEGEIDNMLRLEYARERIAAKFDSGSEESILSVHQLAIVSGTGQEAILTHTGQCQGQAVRRVLSRCMPIRGGNN